MQQMVDAGVKKALAFVVSGYSSYSGCRQYRENLLDGQRQIGEAAPQIDKIRVFYNHPDFIAANADRMRAALQQIPAEAGHESAWPSPLTASPPRWPTVAITNNS